MRPHPHSAAERYRLAINAVAGSNCGAFRIPTSHYVELCIIASDELGWDHVSVHAIDRGKDRIPTWYEMKFVKHMFWMPEETVIQFHPKQSRYKNDHEFTLHMWRQHGVDYVLPPDFMV